MPLTFIQGHDTLVSRSNDLTGASPRTMARPNDPILDWGHDSLGDFGPSGLSVQYTQDVRGCLPAHTGRLWLSVCVCLCLSVRTHMTSVAVHQYTYQHVGPWTKHADPSRGLFG